MKLTQDETEMIGGWATVRYCDEVKPLKGKVYFSFGQYDEANEADTFGVWDETIFFYATGENELKEMMKESFTRDFVILDYELVSQKGDK